MKVMFVKIKKYGYIMVLMMTFAILAIEKVQAQEEKGNCRPVNINISTGVDNAGSLLAIGATDPNWAESTGMNNVCSPNAVWGSLVGSQWLGKNSAVASYTTFSYSRTFTIPLGASGTINFTALADNNVKLYLNTTLIAGTSVAATIYGFLNANVVTYTASIPSGTYTLTAEVYNEDDQSGFNLSGSVSYVVANASIDISTGINSLGILPPGSIDPNWTSFPLGYNTVTISPPAAWDNFTGSTWLGQDAPHGVYYDFKRSFTVPAGGGYIDFEAMGDNSVDIYLDATLLVSSPGPIGYGFLLPNKVSYFGSVSPGSHILTAKVYNYGADMGLNLHGTVSYCRVGNQYPCSTDPLFSGVFAGINTAQFNSSTNPINNSYATITETVTVSHYWTFGDGGTSTLPNPIHSYMMPGIYSVKHTVFKTITNNADNSTVECSYSAICNATIDNGDVPNLVTCNTGGGNPPEKKAQSNATYSTNEVVSLFPNPATSEIRISKYLNDCELYIFSLDAKNFLYRKAFSGDKVDISQLARGTYILRIVNSEQVVNLKFCKTE